jgi:hypothetical protein
MPNNYKLPSQLEFKFFHKKFYDLFHMIMTSRILIGYAEGLFL